MKKHKRKELGLAPLSLIGTAIALGSISVISLALAMLSALTNNPTALIGAFSLLALLTSGTLSGFITSRISGDGGKLVSTVSSLISAAIMLLIGMIWRGGALPIGSLINVAAFIGVSVVFAILGGKRKRKRNTRRYL